MGAQDKFAAIMYLAGKSQFHILECEALAKELGVGNRMTFDIVGPKGRMPCRWTDAHYGIFERTDQPDDAAFHTKQFQFVADVHCENLENFS
jgi:hypothetical protein